MPNIVKPALKKQRPIGLVRAAICMSLWAYIALLVLVGWPLGSIDDYPANHAFETALMAAVLFGIARIRAGGKTDGSEG